MIQRAGDAAVAAIVAAQADREDVLDAGLLRAHVEHVLEQLVAEAEVLHLGEHVDGEELHDRAVGRVEILDVAAV